ncbi:hypothetical protein MRX96_024881 [Rhipicephalus microplus]
MAGGYGIGEVTCGPLLQSVAITTAFGPFAAEKRRSPPLRWHVDREKPINRAPRHFQGVETKKERGTKTRRKEDRDSLGIPARLNKKSRRRILPPFPPFFFLPRTTFYFFLRSGQEEGARGRHNQTEEGSN